MIIAFIGGSALGLIVGFSINWYMVRNLAKALKLSNEQRKTMREMMGESAALLKNMTAVFDAQTAKQRSERLKAVGVGFESQWPHCEN